MLSFKKFVLEQVIRAPGEVEKPGIQHLHHTSDLTFNGSEAAKHVIKTLRSVAAGKEEVTAKADGSPAVTLIRHPDGRVGAKYKGSGAHYNYSEADVEQQHGHKPYLAEPLKALVKHAGKILPKEPGEYQADVMHHPGKPATTENGTTSFQPNTIRYSVPSNSEEGKKVRRAKVGLVVHTKLEGPNGSPSPITSLSGFQSHPDVHLMSHVVSPEERKIHPEDRKVVEDHINKAEELLSQQTHAHTAGHELNLRTYINHTVRTGETPSVEGFRTHLAAAHDKKIAGVKTDAAKASKQAAKDADMAHIDKNKEAFARTFQIHHHVQQATNILANSLSRKAHGGYGHEIDGRKAEPEGFVSGGMKIVDRSPASPDRPGGFSAANFARSAAMRGK